MPISLDDYRKPKFVKIPDHYPLGTDKNAKYWETSEDNQYRRYRTEDGSFPQQGYNPNHRTSKISKININKESYTLPGY